MKHIDQFWIDGFDHFDRRTAGVKMKTVDNEPKIWTRGGAHDLVREAECLHAAIRLAQKLEGERNIVTRGDVAEFSQHAHGFVYYFRARSVWTGKPARHHDDKRTADLGRD